jgi:Ni/Co efflux regulator RcnB
VVVLSNLAGTIVTTALRGQQNKGDVQMKKIIIALLAVTVFAGSAVAADVIEMKKNVSFKHKAHADALKDCTKCHAKAEGGKIDGFGKDYAHKACKDCHNDMKKGPTNCKGCHPK